MASKRAGRHRVAMGLYAATILVSAFLLFQVQPMIAKIILPWYGGSAAVWSTCLLFFQMVLLLGYLYAHLVTRYLKPKAQTYLHIGLMLASLLALRVYPSVAWKPSGHGDPTFGILGLLSATVGLPYLLLSTTGPLLQAWYARQFSGEVPYRLYALSNAGSMFALLSYPFLFEPNFTTHQQALIWSVGYVAFVGLCGLTGWTASKALAAAAFSTDEMDESAEKPRPGDYVLWLALPACASMLLLSVSSYVTQNIAAIPFLWVLPLSLYLLSFILCFDGRGWLRYRRLVYIPLMVVLLAGMALAIEGLEDAPIWQLIAIFGLGLFACCVVMHGELTLRKPHPKYLTNFYLSISGGGALGGFIVGFVAPRLFHSAYELELAMALCVLLALAAMAGKPDPGWMERLLPWRRLLPVAVAAIFTGYLGFLYSDRILDVFHRAVHAVARKWEPTDTADSIFQLLALLWLFGIILAAKHGWRNSWVKRDGLRPFAAELMGMLLIGFLGYVVGDSNTGYVQMARNFYGSLKVAENGTRGQADWTRGLLHGTINHGEQFLMGERRYWAITYYSENSGIGVAILSKQKTVGQMRVGVIGLGTGTTAAYGRAGDRYTFYEINPLVEQLARTEFSYLKDCKGSVDVVLGDARISLEREAPQEFDVLAVDAFSSDSIPVHLLTLEAMQLYFRHLKPDGILAVHISNKYLDLAPVVAGISRATDHITRLVVNEEDRERGVLGSAWVLVTARDPGFDESVTSRSKIIDSSRRVRLWTDDYSNLFQILR